MSDEVTIAPNEAPEAEPTVIDHVVTEEDLAANPGLAAEGVEVGDTIGLVEPTEEAPTPEAPTETPAA